MKILLVISVLIIHSLFAIGQTETGYHIFYGVNLNQVSTGSGHGSEYVINTNFQQGRKSLELGMLVQNNSRISGGDMKYKIFLGKNASLETKSATNKTAIKSYLHYNCLYHNSIVKTPDLVFLSGKKTGAPGPPGSVGTIATIEHFTGFGMQLIIPGNFVFDGSIGMGTYLGSLDKMNNPNTIGIHRENHGFVLAVEFGLGYRFGL